MLAVPVTTLLKAILLSKLYSLKRLPLSHQMLQRDFGKPSAYLGPAHHAIALCATADGVPDRT